MRIKIQGELTAERLAEALQVASNEYETVCPGSKIYGANLYLTAFDVNGLPFDLVDHRRKPRIITLKAKSGLVKPALTAKGEEYRQKVKEEAAARQAEEEAKEEAARQRAILEWQEREEKAAQSMRLFESLNEKTEILVKQRPEYFLGELNKIVHDVWHNLQPKETRGLKKGQPKALPIFSIQDDSLWLSVEAWKSPRQMRNPIFTMQYGKLSSIWTDQAWKEAETRILELLQAPSENKNRIYDNSGTSN